MDFDRLLDAAVHVDVSEFRQGRADSALTISTSGSFSLIYAPFDHVNTAARIVIVGLTPGRFQASEAIAELQRQRAMGADWPKALACAKAHASFSGPMRANLTAMLDAVGVADALGLQTCQELFRPASALAHFTSAVRYPLFVRGLNYSGTPPITGNPWLMGLAQDWLTSELDQLRNPIIVPLGPKVDALLRQFASDGLLDPANVLSGLPHPSGANAERIAYFLGRKLRKNLSSKCNADALDQARTSLRAKVLALSARR